MRLQPNYPPEAGVSEELTGPGELTPKFIHKAVYQEDSVFHYLRLSVGLLMT